MDLKDVIGGLLNQSGNQPDEQTSGEGANPLGSILSSLGGQNALSQVLGSLTSGDSGQRGGLVGSLLSGLSSSGVDISSLLGQLGINPEVANNPEAASHEDLTKLAAHAQENAPDVLQSAVDQHLGDGSDTDQFNIDGSDAATDNRSVEASAGSASDDDSSVDSEERSSDDDSSDEDSDDKRR